LFKHRNIFKFTYRRGKFNENLVAIKKWIKMQLVIAGEQMALTRKLESVETGVAGDDPGEGEDPESVHHGQGAFPPFLGGEKTTRILPQGKRRQNLNGATWIQFAKLIGFAYAKNNGLVLQLASVKNSARAKESIL